jgi:endonuclease YncB( thermonuclease family)
MKSSFFVLFLLGFQVTAATMVPGSVERVIDGDTVVFKPGTAITDPNHFELMDASKNPHVRMVGLDTPETHLSTATGVHSQGQYGNEATEYLRKLVGGPGSKVTLENFGFDKYHRVLGRIYKGNRDLHLEMIRSGLAVTYFLCIPQEGCDGNFMVENKVREYITACNEARSEGRGIWNRAEPLEEMPFEFRMRLQGRKPERWTGDAMSRKLYKPSDYKKVSACNRIFFNHQDDARVLGFK